jgi:DNA-nicking Smr family endonuclease
MAKKTSKTAKSSAPRKACKPSAGKAPAKSQSKKSPPKQHDHDHSDEQGEEIELDDVERDAIDHIVDCEEARDALEQEVNNAVSQAVRKICKVHGKALTSAQAQNVAMVLFGD